MHLKIIYMGDIKKLYTINLIPVAFLKKSPELYSGDLFIRFLILCSLLFICIYNNK